MTPFDAFFTALFESEKGLADDKDDRGGITKHGITLPVAKALAMDMDRDGDVDAEDIRLLTPAQARQVAGCYWSNIKADFFRSAKVAAFVADWAYHSTFVKDSSFVIRKVQRVVGTPADGIMGPKTLAAINGRDPDVLLRDLGLARLDFFIDIVVRDATQRKFLNGWRNRVRRMVYPS